MNRVYTTQSQLWLTPTLAPLYKGGAGGVYGCMENPDYVIKILEKSSPLYKERIDYQASLHISNPALVLPIEGISKAPGTEVVGFVMKRATNTCTLHEFTTLAAQKRLDLQVSPSDICRVLLAVANAYAELHKYLVYHTDIHLDNILVGITNGQFDGRVFIIDLDCSTCAGYCCTEHKVAFLPPERKVDINLKPDELTDRWSIYRLCWVSLKIADPYAVKGNSDDERLALEAAGKFPHGSGVKCKDKVDVEPYFKDLPYDLKIAFDKMFSLNVNRRAERPTLQVLIGGLQTAVSTFPTRAPQTISIAAPVNQRRGFKLDIDPKPYVIGIAAISAVVLLVVWATLPRQQRPKLFGPGFFKNLQERIYAREEKRHG